MLVDQLLTLELSREKEERETKVEQSRRCESQLCVHDVFRRLHLCSNDGDGLHLPQSDAVRRRS